MVNVALVLVALPEVKATLGVIVHLVNLLFAAAAAAVIVIFSPASASVGAAEPLVTFMVYVSANSAAADTFLTPILILSVSLSNEPLSISVPLGSSCHLLNLFPILVSPI
jgi:hypothetical protein